MTRIDTELERAGAEFRHAGEALPDRRWDKTASGWRPGRPLLAVTIGAAAVLLFALPIALLGNGGTGPGNEPSGGATDETSSQTPTTIVDDLESATLDEMLEALHVDSFSEALSATPLQRLLAHGALSADEYTETVRQINEDYRECLQGHGYSTDEELMDSRFYDRFKLDYVREHGFGVAAGSGPIPPEPVPGALASEEERVRAQCAAESSPGDEVPYSFSQTELALLTQLSDTINNAPEIAQATRTWAACMADEGYTFTNRDEMLFHVQDEGWDMVVRADGDFGEEFERDKSAVLQREIAIALADFGCKPTVETALLRTTIREELQFIEANPALADRLTTAWTESAR